MQCQQEAVEKGYDVGEALYNQHFFFCDSVMLYDEDCQSLIKKYIFCDTFKCPPYASLDETPAELVDNFLLIKAEIRKARKAENQRIGQRSDSDIHHHPDGSTKRVSVKDNRGNFGNGTKKE